jgi:large subunit ribosomal protein L33
MAGKSKKIVKIKLNSTGKTKEGKPTGVFYTTTKNPKNVTEKLKKKKFDRRAYNPETGKAGMHVLFEEGKIK